MAMGDTDANTLDARQRVDVLAADVSPFRLRARRVKVGLVNAFQELLRSRTATIGAIIVACLLAVVIFAQSLATHNPVKSNYRLRTARCTHAMDICKQEVPIFKEGAPNHFAACHLND